MWAHCTRPLLLLLLLMVMVMRMRMLIVMRMRMLQQSCAALLMVLLALTTRALAMAMVSAEGGEEGGGRRAAMVGVHCMVQGRATSRMKRGMGRRRKRVRE